MTPFAYRALLRRLLGGKSKTAEPVPASDFPIMRVIRLGRVLSDGANR